MTIRTGECVVMGDDRASVDGIFTQLMGDAPIDRLSGRFNAFCSIMSDPVSIDEMFGDLPDVSVCSVPLGGRAAHLLDTISR